MKMKKMTSLKPTLEPILELEPETQTPSERPTPAPRKRTSSKVCEDEFRRSHAWRRIDGTDWTVVMREDGRFVQTKVVKFETQLWNYLLNH